MTMAMDLAMAMATSMPITITVITITRIPNGDNHGATDSNRNICKKF